MQLHEHQLLFPWQAVCLTKMAWPWIPLRLLIRPCNLFHPPIIQIPSYNNCNNSPFLLHLDVTTRGRGKIQQKTMPRPPRYLATHRLPEKEEGDPRYLLLLLLTINLHPLITNSPPLCLYPALFRLLFLLVFLLLCLLLFLPLFLLHSCRHYLLLNLQIQHRSSINKPGRQ